MAKFAPVVPVSMAASLQRQNDQDHLGGYQLLLAHDILDKPKTYQDIYGRMRAAWGDSFIIMDNSVIELGKPMGIKDLMAASRIIAPDCIVMPDVMGDGAATRAESIKFAREYAQEAFKAIDNMVNPPSLMGVLQGDTVEDAMETLMTFYALPLVDYIGIPRILTKQHGSRMHILQEMMRSPALISTARKSFGGFHLLGFSDDILDDVCCARVPWIQGIDSNVPVRAAGKGVSVSLDDIGKGGWSDRTGPRGDFWEASLDEAGVRLACSNLYKYRNWINA